MTGYAYGSVEDIEIVLAGVALAGLLFSLLNVREAYNDLRAQQAASSNGRHFIAIVGVRVEVARCVMQAILLGFGLLAMLVLTPQDTGDRPVENVLLGIFFRWGGISLAGLLLFQSVENRRLRQYLNNHQTPGYDRREPTDRRTSTPHERTGRGS